MLSSGHAEPGGKPRDAGAREEVDGVLGGEFCAGGARRGPFRRRGSEVGGGGTGGERGRVGGGAGIEETATTFARTCGAVKSVCLVGPLRGTWRSAMRGISTA